MLQVTVEYFGKGIGPDEVFISATVDPASAFGAACTHLGISTILCRGHRLNSAVMRALGLDGSGNACQNPVVKGLIGKCSALVEFFSSSAVNNNALRNQATDKQKEVEDLLHHTNFPGVGGAEQSDPWQLLDTRCALGEAAVCRICVVAVGN